MIIIYYIYISSIKRRCSVVQMYTDYAVMLTILTRFFLEWAVLGRGDSVAVLKSIQHLLFFLFVFSSFFTPFARWRAPRSKGKDRRHHMES